MGLIRELGIAYSKLAKFAQSEEDNRHEQNAKSLHYARLAAEHPAATAYDHESLMKTYTNCAISLAEQGSVAEAIEHYEHAIAVTAGSGGLAADRIL